MSAVKIIKPVTPTKVIWSSGACFCIFEVEYRIIIRACSLLSEHQPGIMPDLTQGFPMVEDGPFGTRHSSTDQALGCTSIDLRHHKKRCCPQKGDRSLQANSRRLYNYIHSRASQTLKSHVAANMYQDV
ncbi:hypothetical protein NQ317_005945, partial [Molorchus minor]